MSALYWSNASSWEVRGLLVASAALSTVLSLLHQVHVSLGQCLFNVEHSASALAEHIQVQHV